MKHLGDITKISGHTAPVVDVVVGGSPCQDLSVAGKRAGLDGERSGLFMEQIRIIKEMREHDREVRGGIDVRPRYMVWENVPGAFSSNKGEDFRVVLEETAKVADKNASVPMPNGGKWSTSGCLMGDGWSIAWRVLDAQFWGVPQRRRRIALVADFGGHSAPEILFVRKGVSGDIEPSKPKGKETPSDTARGFGTDDRLGADQYNAVVLGDTISTLGVNCGMSHGRQCVLEPQTAYTLKIRSGCEGGGKGALIQTDKSATLSTLQDQTLFQPIAYERVVALDRAAFNQGINAKYDFEISEDGISSTLVAKGPSAVCYWDGGQVLGTLTANNAGGSQRMPDKENFNCVIQESVCYRKTAHPRNAEEGQGWEYTDKSDTLNVFDNTEARTPTVVVETDRSVDDTVAPLQARDYKGGKLITTRYIVRRLTPLECERLQGYPDGWTDVGEYIDSKGKKKQSSDAARYKALGNSIAIPPWKWVMKRISACYEREATLASLFDGIGGFPYIWEQINGKGSCLWASEIEEFPIAVTKVRIGE